MTAGTFFELRNRHGLRARLLDFGARLVELWAPDRDGSLGDVVLGLDGVDDYVANARVYLGCTVGRVANRIGGAAFTLDGTEYRLARNDGPNHLHGGTERSFDRVAWRGETSEGPDGDAVRFTYVSPDLEEGYPGTLEATVTYRLTDDDALLIEYGAAVDRACPVNLTNHTYWNLAGHDAGSILGHELTLHADAYTQADDDLIPTGEIAPVDGTALDFREPTTLGARIAVLDRTGAHGYDHNVVVRGEPGALRLAARLRDPAGGRVMEVLTTEPGVQLYTGNFLASMRGKRSSRYDRRGGICLEAQHFPDAVHQPGFPSIVLRPGERYAQTTMYRFSTD